VKPGKVVSGREDGPARPSRGRRSARPRSARRCRQPATTAVGGRPCTRRAGKFRPAGSAGSTRHGHATGPQPAAATITHGQRARAGVGRRALAGTRRRPGGDESRRRRSQAAFVGAMATTPVGAGGQARPGTDGGCRAVPRIRRDGIRSSARPWCRAPERAVRRFCRHPTGLSGHLAACRPGVVRISMLPLRPCGAAWPGPSVTAS